MMKILNKLYMYIQLAYLVHPCYNRPLYNRGS